MLARYYERKKVVWFNVNVSIVSSKQSSNQMWDENARTKPWLLFLIKTWLLPCSFILYFFRCEKYKIKNSVLIKYAFGVALVWISVIAMTFQTLISRIIFLIIACDLKLNHQLNIQLKNGLPCFFLYKLKTFYGSLNLNCRTCKTLAVIRANFDRVWRPAYVGLSLTCFYRLNFHLAFMEEKG